MSATLTHRGPDGTGTWGDAASGLWLGHRRLSVLDLSPAGHQPMLSGSGRYVLSYNGEIYNHPELRAELERLGVSGWRGHSDSETLLAAIEHWGLDNTLPRLNGMFAFALWDTTTRTLSLARDRFGEKPLYYGVMRGTLLFGSELRALRVHPAFEAQLDRASVQHFLARNVCPAAASIYHGMRQVAPAHRLTFTAAGAPPQAFCYWDLKALAAASAPAAASEPDLIAEFDDVLGGAVRQRLLADVPLGAFLSGGYDSSLVVAMMQRATGAPVKTFSIGFEQELFNEAPFAAAVARHLGTAHTELLLTADMARATVPELAQVWDEPFADSSQIPTLLLARMTRTEVTVALSGDGADELFGGYRRYRSTARTWRRLQRAPRAVRLAAAAAIAPLAPALGPVAGAVTAAGRGADGLARLGDLLRLRDATALYDYKLRHWVDPAGVVTGAREALPEALRGYGIGTQQAHLGGMLCADALTYLPEDILVKVDRAAMAASLETRIPFLDPAVAAFSWRLPDACRIRGNHGKWLLRRLAHQYVPATLLERPKQGFSVPIETWLRGPLRDWAEDLLAADRLARQGLLEPAPIRRVWEDFQRGRGRRHKLLWDVLMLQSWLDCHHDGHATWA